MAGIGFRLSKYFEKRDLITNLQGSIFSILISSGPWLISVLTIASISYFSAPILSIRDSFIFKGIISYTFAGALILFGILEMPLTRYIADKLYNQDFSTLRSTYLFFVCLLCFLGSFFALLFYQDFNFPASMILTGMAFFCSVLTTWVSMVFLSAAKHYQKIVISFALGGLASLVCSVYLGTKFKLYGFLIGFTLGQMSTAVMLSVNTYLEFQGAEFFTLEFLKYFKECWKLVLVGLFYYLGIWVDKFVFWFSHEGKHIIGPLYTNFYYDTALFFAYLSIVPSLAVFLVKIETTFFVKYTYYFHSIDKKSNLFFLEDTVKEIYEAIKITAWHLIRVQFFITFLLWYFSYEVLDFLKLPVIMLPIFRYGLLGVFFQILFLISNILLLYFKDELAVLCCNLTFLVCNGLLAAITIQLGPRFHGLGYLLTTMICFILSYLLLNKRLKFIHYFTFMGQGFNQQSLMENIR